MGSEQCGNHCREFGSAVGRWLDGVRVVGGIGANQAQVEDGDTPLGGDAQDGVVPDDDSESGETLIGGIGEVAVIDGADGGGKGASKDGIEHPAIGPLELVLDGGETGERLGDRGGGRAEDVEVAQGVVAANAHDEVSGVRGDIRKLPWDISGDIAIHCAEGGAPVSGESRAKLANDVWFTRLDVGLIVEDGVAEQNNMWHGGCPPRVVRIAQVRQDVPLSAPL